MGKTFSYRHLHYFWVVAKEGGIARAAARLGVAVQTVSAQVRDLERDLGHALLKPVGRRLALTEAGEAVLRQADQIFALGEQLPGLLADIPSSPRVHFAVGISDGVPKIVVHTLLQPVIDDDNLHLLCHEDEFDDLLGDLALHRLDAVVADQQAPANPNLKVYTHPLGSSAVAWYATATLHASARRGFPRSLARTPVLLPTSHSAIRFKLDRWFEQEGIRPHVVGEFEDSALLAAFGAAGMGVFPAPVWSDRDLTQQHGLKRLGPCAGVEEDFFLVCAERKVVHPLVQRLLDLHPTRSGGGG
jgi:LysR family transcriptional regulator, transcriptional activator of nhaA